MVPFFCWLCWLFPPSNFLHLRWPLLVVLSQRLLLLSGEILPSKLSLLPRPRAKPVQARRQVTKKSALFCFCTLSFFDSSCRHISINSDSDDVKEVETKTPTKKAMQCVVFPLLSLSEFDSPSLSRVRKSVKVEVSSDAETLHQEVHQVSCLCECASGCVLLAYRDALELWSPLRWKIVMKTSSQSDNLLADED